MSALLTAAVALALAAPPAPAKAPVGPADAAPPGAVPAPVSEAPLRAPGSGGLPAAPPAAAPDLPPPPAVRLAVVPLAALGELALLGRSLAEAVAEEARAAGFDALGPAGVAGKLGEEGTLQASRCGDAASCLAAPGVRLGVAWVVGGSIERLGSNYRFSLVLVDPRTGAAKARAEREVPIAARRLRADVVAVAGPLLRGEATGTGLLALRTDEPGADVRIDDRPAGRTPLEVRLPAGKHKVEVMKAGKVRLEPFWVEVPPDGRVEPQVRLYDLPVSERKAGEVETTTIELGRAKRKGK